MRDTLVRPGVAVYVSSVTFYELGYKHALGKLAFPPEALRAGASDAGFAELPLTARHALRAAALPLHHRDPFDRLLIAQALQDGLTLVTRDALLAVYDAPLLPC